MRVPVKSAGSRRPAVGTSKPTYIVDLTSEEIDVLHRAAMAAIGPESGNSHRDERLLASAATVLHWARWGRS